MAKSKPNIRSLFYITHLDNLPSIVQHGILSHAQVEARGLSPTPIYDANIVSRRRERQAPDGRSLWEFANLYFQARNPMLYRVIGEKGKQHVVIIGIDPSVMELPGCLIAAGNAASPLSEIVPVAEGLPKIAALWKVINSEWWRQADGSKRVMMAECLVPDIISPTYLQTIYTPNHKTAETVHRLMPDCKIPVVPEPNLFFQPNFLKRLTETISLIDGDLFFSQHQTLTISVNTMGVMGKGLASRAKYQFPDVYVVYQDACRNKQLQMGKPYLYRREASIDEELADDPASLTNPNANKWFLLFATKRHWREQSDIKGIERGLQWLQEHYASEGIRSLAVPALGCGLGGLDWRDVGPLMCRYLATLPIPVSIYLPRTQQIGPELLTPEFLLQ
ncbi:MAG: DarT ssDNA thymidine ADP-ribosyltransferase family protein [Chloroflexus sp.]|nr:DarT ssDNA thymidine ADP-ribosyltransferase family protein [Chloroflexus sp.]